MQKNRRRKYHAWAPLRTNLKGKNVKMSRPEKQYRHIQYLLGTLHLSGPSSEIPPCPLLSKYNFDVGKNKNEYCLQTKYRTKL
jgi:hypothetical protein